MSMKALVFVVSIVGVVGYETGAPNNYDTCHTMEPQHGYGVSAQALYSAPYSIVANASYYRPNGPSILVEVHGNSMRGLLLQARKVASDMWSSPVGTWDFLGWPGQYNTSNFKKMTCSSYGDSITHSHGQVKHPVFSFLWRPPYWSQGNIHFMATIVQSKRYYWTKINSTMLEPDMINYGDDWHHNTVTHSYYDGWKNYFSGACRPKEAGLGIIFAVTFLISEFK